MHIYWRSFLYYSIGFLPPLFFGARVLLQWIGSERKKKSVVTPLFWRLSITGNLLMAIHYFIQFQYQFLLLQVMNAFIAWRNLNFLQKKRVPFSFRKALQILVTVLIITFAFCYIQNLYTGHKGYFFNLPVGPISKKVIHVPILWHVFGILGGLLFSSRFWVQWLVTEKNKFSELNEVFWLLSIFGSLLMLVYFIRILDWVSIINYSFGLFPYIRNLILIRKEKSKIEMG